MNPSRQHPTHKIIKPGLLCLIGFLLSGCRPSQPTLVTVGVINFVPAMDPVLDGFKDGMAAEGYVEGENIAYVYQGPAGSQPELEQIAQALVESQVDILLAMSTPATRAAQQATQGTNIPIVFVPVTDPVTSAIVASLSQPGGNTTGITNGGSESRRLEWLLQLVPVAKRVYVPYNPSDGSAVAALAAAEAAAAKLGVELVPRQARNDEEMLATITTMPTDVDAVFMLPDSLAIKHIDTFVAATIERSLPLAGPTTREVERGALVTFGIDFYAAGRQAARLADQILEDVSPSDLPVESAEFFLSINLATADKIGLDVANDILAQANEIIRQDDIE